MNKIKALTFDTGGTILDWHSGFRDALKIVGDKYNYKKDWSSLANELRRRSLKSMLNLGENDPPQYNFDDAHSFILEELIKENNLTNFTKEDIQYIAYETVHNLKCWEDFPDTLPKLKKKLIVCSFTILSYRIIIDTARKNSLDWDAVFSCEGIKKYKLLPEAYNTVSRHLQLKPDECMKSLCRYFYDYFLKNQDYLSAIVFEAVISGLTTFPFRSIPIPHLHPGQLRQVSKPRFTACVIASFF